MKDTTKNKRMTLDFNDSNIMNNEDGNKIEDMDFNDNKIGLEKEVRK